MRESTGWRCFKYGMDDLRAFFDGDIRWLKHYGFRALDVQRSGGVGA